jgi:hypothetical protein
MTGSDQKFFGKYRGTVINNIDPLMEGRLMVEVPDVLSLSPSSWAVPCVPLAGPTGPPMGVYLVPPIGAGVWIEFEKGDPDYPIWVGCRWGSAAGVPTLALAGLPVSPNIVLQTAGQTAVVISDVPAVGVMLKSSAGTSMILVNDIGITIQTTGLLTLTGTTVAINETALVIT